MKIDWENYLIQMAISAVAILSFILILGCLSSCASTGDVRSDEAKLVHEVIVTKKQVVVPAVEGVPEHVVLLTETVERWLDEKTKTDSHEDRHMAPDIPAVAAAANTGIQLLPSGLGGGLGDLVKMGLAYGTAYIAAKGTIKKLEADSTEGWQEARRHQERAEKYALKLPPTTAMDDHA